MVCRLGSLPRHRFRKLFHFGVKAMLTPGGKNVEYSEYLCGIAMEFLRLYDLLRLSLNASLALITSKKTGYRVFQGVSEPERK